MAHAAFDTLKFVEKLIAAGVPNHQAKAISEAQNEAFHEALDSALVTKTDLLRTEASLKQDISTVENNLTQKIDRVESGLVQKISAVEHGLMQKITLVENRLEEKISAIKGETQLLKWMLGFLLAGVASLIIKAFF